MKNKLIKNFFDKKELDLLHKYTDYKLNSNKDYVIDDYSFSPAWYNDALMISFLDTKLSLVEKESKFKLYPTYAYWRYYVHGADLKKHTDRPSCEISITACIKKYDDWPIVVEDKEFELNEGDALLYLGCDQVHWRPSIYKGEGMAQVFLHYINQNGPFTHHKYDEFYKRTGKKEREGDFKE